MKCPACGEENDDDSQFCVQCRHNLARLSPSPEKKKGIGLGVWIGGALVLVVLAGIYFGWFSLFFPPKYDCSVQQGSIEIQNDPHSDVYLTLRDENNNIAKSLYLTAGSYGTMSNICNGRYYLYYQFGKQWNPSSKTFAIQETTKKFNDPVNINGADVYDVSLVPGSGNARTSTTTDNKTEQK
jgi:hypothetical protein